MNEVNPDLLDKRIQQLLDYLYIDLNVSLKLDTRRTTKIYSFVNDIIKFELILSQDGIFCYAEAQNINPSRYIEVSISYEEFINTDKFYSIVRSFYYIYACYLGADAHVGVWFDSKGNLFKHYFYLTRLKIHFLLNHYADVKISYSFSDEENMITLILPHGRINYTADAEDETWYSVGDGTVNIHNAWGDLLPDEDFVVIAYRCLINHLLVGFGHPYTENIKLYTNIKSETSDTRFPPSAI
jgi:hypothetical protein